MSDIRCRKWRSSNIGNSSHFQLDERLLVADHTQHLPRVDASLRAPHILPSPTSEQTRHAEGDHKGNKCSDVLELGQDLRRLVAVYVKRCRD